MSVRCADLTNLKAALLALLLVVPVNTLAQYTYPQGMKQVGQASLSLFWVEVYDARLFSEDGEYDSGERPVLLELTYHRAISGEDLLDATAKQLKDSLDAETLAQALGLLQPMLPDVKKGDRLAFYLTEQGRGRLFLNSRYLGGMDDPALNRAFLDIWLAPDSDFPELTRRLTGGG
ncbi:chalcone isomerase family protein [Marinobacterium sp. YM272]|uniref:chalcone isomerase family protein n=1 Tax=Marinobacterium sp. YM272 TaxID=3421654 RepID=UPI003D7FF157